MKQEYVKKRSSDRGLASKMHNPVATITLMFTILIAIIAGTVFITRADATANNALEKSEKNEEKLDVFREQIRKEFKELRNDISEDMREVFRELSKN